MEFTDSIASDDVFPRRMVAYLVERYLPGTSFEQVRAGAERLAAAADQIARRGGAATYLGSLFVPADEAILDIILAPSADDVARIGEQAGTIAARVSEALLIAPSTREREPLQAVSQTGPFGSAGTPS